ncbi:hypothetical protein HK104_001042, partial [Borealophlyctis nickersoniae]
MSRSGPPRRYATAGGGGGARPGQTTDGTPRRYSQHARDGAGAGGDRARSFLDRDRDRRGSGVSGGGYELRGSGGGNGVMGRRQRRSSHYEEGFRGAGGGFQQGGGGYQNAHPHPRFNNAAETPEAPRRIFLRDDAPSDRRESFPPRGGGAGFRGGRPRSGRGNFRSNYRGESESHQQQPPHTPAPPTSAKRDRQGSQSLEPPQSSDFQVLTLEEIKRRKKQKIESDDSSGGSRIVGRGKEREAGEIASSESPSKSVVDVPLLTEDVVDLHTTLENESEAKGDGEREEELETTSSQPEDIDKINVLETVESAGLAENPIIRAEPSSTIWDIREHEDDDVLYDDDETNYDEDQESVEVAKVEQEGTHAKNGHMPREDILSPAFEEGARANLSDSANSDKPTESESSSLVVVWRKEEIVLRSVEQTTDERIRETDYTVTETRLLEDHHQGHSLKNGDVNIKIDRTTNGDEKLEEHASEINSDRSGEALREAQVDSGSGVQKREDVEGGQQEEQTVSVGDNMGPAGVVDDPSAGEREQVQEQQLPEANQSPLANFEESVGGTTLSVISDDDMKTTPVLLLQDGSTRDGLEDHGAETPGQKSDGSNLVARERAASEINSPLDTSAAPSESVEKPDESDTTVQPMEGIEMDKSGGEGTREVNISQPDTKYLKPATPPYPSQRQWNGSFRSPEKPDQSRHRERGQEQISRRPSRGNEQEGRGYHGDRFDPWRSERGRRNTGRDGNLGTGDASTPRFNQDRRRSFAESGERGRSPPPVRERGSSISERRGPRHDYNSHADGRGRASHSRGTGARDPTSDTRDALNNGRRDRDSRASLSFSRDEVTVTERSGANTDVPGASRASDRDVDSRRPKSRNSVSSGGGQPERRHRRKHDETAEVDDHPDPKRRRNEQEGSHRSEESSRPGSALDIVKHDSLSFFNGGSQARNRVDYLREISRICQTDGPFDGIISLLDEMEDHDITIPSDLGLAVIRECARHGDVETMQQSFDHLRRAHREPSKTAYMIVIQGYARAGDATRLRQVIDLAGQDKLDLTIADCTAVWRMVPEGKTPDVMRILAETMQKQTLRATDVDYFVPVLRDMIKSSLTAETYALFKHVQRLGTGRGLAAETLEELAEFYVKARQHANAYEVLKYAREKGVPLGRSIELQLFDECCQRPRLRTLGDEMYEFLRPSARDFPFFASALRMYMAAEQPLKAIKVLEDLGKLPIDPHVFDVLGPMLKFSHTHGKIREYVEAAMRIFEAARGVFPHNLDVALCAEIVSACTDANLSDSSIALLRCMKRCGVVPTPAVYQQLFQGLARGAWKPKDVWEIYNEADQSGYTLSDDQRAIFIDALRRAGDWGSAVKFLEDVSVASPTLLSKLPAESLFEIYAFANQFESAEQEWEKLRLLDTFSLSEDAMTKFIDAACKHSHFHVAEQFVRDMRRAKVAITAEFVHRSIATVDGYESDQRIAVGVRLFCWGVEVDVVKPVEVSSIEDGVVHAEGCQSLLEISLMVVRSFEFMCRYFGTSNAWPRFVTIRVPRSLTSRNDVAEDVSRWLEKDLVPWMKGVRIPRSQRGGGDASVLEIVGRDMRDWGDRFTGNPFDCFAGMKSKDIEGKTLLKGEVPK